MPWPLSAHAADRMRPPPWVTISSNRRIWQTRAHAQVVVLQAQYSSFPCIYPYRPLWLPVWTRGFVNHVGLCSYEGTHTAMVNEEGAWEAAAATLAGSELRTNVGERKAGR